MNDEEIKPCNECNHNMDIVEILQAITDVRASLTDSLNTLNNLMKEWTKSK